MTQEDNHTTPNLGAFLALECTVWDALVAGDSKGDLMCLSADFVGVYPSGFATRGDHVGQLADGPVMEDYTLDQARLVAAGRGHALLCYRATFRRVGSVAPEIMYISSLWALTSDGWINTFSQDTPAA
jgi:hypothetical protein